MASNQTLEVDLIGKSLSFRYTDDQNGTKDWEHHPVCRIVSITGNVVIGFGARDPITNQRAQKYRWDDLLVVTIELDGPHQPDIEFDLNQVSNQAGWTLNQAGVTQAIADINAWADTCSNPSGGPGGGATEGTLQLLLGELIKDFDFEIKCVRDVNTGIVYILRIQKNETDGTVVFDYLDATGAVVVPPVPGDLVVCDATASLALILAELQAQGSGTSSTVTAIAINAANVTLQASNTSRKSLIIVNDSDQILYVKHGATAVVGTDYTWKVGIDETVVIADYTGIVDGIWAAGGSGNALVTETT